ncbi:hypothetical protein ACFFX0_17685 [Citricoccus parietis]|uniref:Uncharacterized protein n=1 Tax=Citricoccus parietis TaxID=592307 RepID=A0ABV5G1W6_9MICC
MATVQRAHGRDQPHGGLRHSGGDGDPHPLRERGLECRPGGVHGGQVTGTRGRLASRVLQGQAGAGGDGGAVGSAVERGHGASLRRFQRVDPRVGSVALAFKGMCATASAHPSTLPLCREAGRSPPLAGTEGRGDRQEHHRRPAEEHIPPRGLRGGINEMGYGEASPQHRQGCIEQSGPAGRHHRVLGQGQRVVPGGAELLHRQAAGGPGLAQRLLDSSFHVTVPAYSPPVQRGAELTFPREVAHGAPRLVDTDLDSR